MMEITLQIAIEKYHNVINNLIKVSFPSLKEKDIKIVERLSQIRDLIFGVA